MTSNEQATSSNLASNKQSDNKRRGKSFSSAEDRKIALAWLSVSQDPVKGTDQQLKVFWTKIQQHAEMMDRNWDSIRQRWGVISRLVAKFVGCYEAVSRVRVTGKTDEDIYKDTVALYLQETESKEWKFCECWEVLRNAPKFRATHERNAKRSLQSPSSRSQSESSRGSVAASSETDSQGDCANDSDRDDDSRPIGNKKAKLLKAQQKLDQRRAKALEAIASAAARKNEILADHTQALKSATELKLLTIPEESLDSVSLLIVQLKKDEILRELQNRMDIVIEQSDDPANGIDNENHSD